MTCFRCGKEKIEQREDGTGGYEIGISKWFSSIEPWAIQLPLCKKCLKRVAKAMGLLDHEMDRVEKQTPRKELEI